VRLREVRSRPGDLGDSVIARVRAGNPGQHVPGLAFRASIAGPAASGLRAGRPRGLCLGQAEPTVQQLVPFGSQADALPAVDHPDEGIMSRKRVMPRSPAELAGQLGHIPSPAPPPCRSVSPLISRIAHRHLTARTRTGPRGIPARSQAFLLVTIS
jgi:hypothetical protein